MTTKAPPAIAEFAPLTNEKIAYASVEDIPVREPNDRNRLGLHVWLYLSGKIPTIADAVRTAHARALIDDDEVVALISEKLADARS